MTSSETTHRSVAPGRARPARTSRRRQWRRLQVGLLVGLTSALVAPVATYAQTGGEAAGPPEQGGGYVTTTLPEPSLDVSGFAPECIRDAPVIRYTIVPLGFTPSSTRATLTISDRNGNLLETQTVDSLSGSIIWPGATVDADGTTTDWPGWKRADDGVSWIPDPSDAFVREGLTIAVTVDSTQATATVSYPPDDAVCANPPDGTTPTTVPSPTTTICVPGRNQDGTPADDCSLARTGGGPGNALILGGAVLLAGLLFLTAARRRRQLDRSLDQT